MSSHKKRTYDSSKRQTLAAQTRARILKSAKLLFQAHGFEGATIEQLAQAAEVSMPTIYALFQSKRGILRALMDEALPPDEFENLVRQFTQEKSPQARLAVTAKMTRQLYDAEQAEMDIFRGASLVASEFKELEQEREQRRYQRQKKAIDILKADHALSKNLSTSQARDILWVFTGRDMYRLFVVERGWTSDEYEQWLAQWLVQALLK
jgi:AcrR family transcriptional regulator